MYNKTWKSLVLVGMLIFKIKQFMQQLQDAEMVSDILDHPVHKIIECPTKKAMV